jgi:co-chaperonin GroES (HSP10)
MKIVPVGPRVLIKPDRFEEVTKGGIVLVKDLVQKEQLAQVRGTILALGELAFRDQEMRDVQTILDSKTTITEREGRPWVKVGDRVTYQRYAGMKIPDSESETGFVEDVLLINDRDITAILLEE